MGSFDTAPTSPNPICETVLINLDQIFPHFQDRELLGKVQSACRNKELWTSQKVFLEKVIDSLEKARRWGMVCSCCREARRVEQRRMRCPRASRRLKEARKFTASLVQQLNRAATELSLEMCEGVQWVHRAVSYCLRKVASDLKAKNAYRKYHG